ncbi:MAG: prepilin peptidase [Hyphomicrobiaceae bacterium]|nr:prepilin peptidase [Hyphomicrobiaceae bacterium]
MLEMALLTIFPGAMAMAGAMDLLTLTIPNRISLALIIGFFILAPLAGLGLTDIASHVACGLATLVVGFLLFARGLIGGGDAKVLAAAGLWIGFEMMLQYTFLVAIAGGALALSLAFYRSMAMPRWALKQDWAVRLHDRNGGIPYGIALAAGALWIYPSTQWLTGG